MTRSANAVVVVLGLLLGVAEHAVAQPARWQGPHIVRIDGDDVFIDLGTPLAINGATLDVWRVLEVRHPITRQVLRDRLLIGRLQVLQAGDVLSIARLSGAPWRALEVGDEVGPRNTVTPVSSQTSAAGEPRACAPTPCPRCDAAQADPDSAAVLRVWTATLGQPPATRIQLYRAFLDRLPASRYAAYVRADIASLEAYERERTEQREAAAEPVPFAEQPAEPLQPIIAHDPLSNVTAGDPLELAARVVSDGASAPRSLIAYIRRRAATDYASLPMVIDERGYARVRVPRGMVQSPGFDYFIEAVAADGRATPIVHGAAEPIRVDVAPPPDVPDPSIHRSRVRFSAEGVSFQNLSGRDAFFVSEGDFLYRTLFYALYGVRVGYGVIEGRGGTVADLDTPAGAGPRPSGFTYGYTEAELRLTDLFALIARIEVGLGRPANSADARNGLTGGFQLRLRIGPENGTHLLLAGETAPEIGQRAYLGLHWETVRKFPMQAEVHVTDQPVNSNELAVRLVYELGWRVSDVLALSLRVSYQGRTINHAGPGVGLAMTFDW